MAKFIPVTKDDKEQERFPGLRVITLNKDPRKGHKTMTLSKEAATALKIEEDSNFLAIARGYDSEERVKVHAFLYRPAEKSITYTNAEGKLYSKKAAVVNASTLNFKSTWIYEELEMFHTDDEDDTEDRHFLLEETDDGEHWKLIEFHQSKTYEKVDEIDDVVVVPFNTKVEDSKEEDETFVTEGKDADVELA